ncbi:uncharacterized protein TRIVIDRAFT_187106 [Trichoderma virens Gv29-8]|uniref:Uncharacterized protein n=1 Tax=Hypocrea virens (strain Gv29-8 / FGSC 10586) TaxID=413071 RepID=G9N4N3_HYPVG|nr:uncharacterized protein TRIVIDRAFT_187106 [Trichoderma virens Gv29-8]EHK18557.1 hypothetical protein TRIVIDRAFT_187106 [Trichoderma virens Gv29-8]
MRMSHPSRNQPGGRMLYLGFSASPAACRGFVSLTCVANVQWHLRLNLLLPKTVVRLAPMHFHHITLKGTQSTR